MLCFHFIEELLGTQGVKLTGEEFDGKKYVIRMELPRKAQVCPVCGEQTEAVHDYRKQRIKAGETNGYLMELEYRKRILRMA